MRQPSHARNSRGTQYQGLQETLAPRCSFIPNSRERKRTEGHCWWTDEREGAGALKLSIFESFPKGRNSAVFDNMRRPRRHCGKWNKPDPRSQMLPIYLNTQTHRWGEAGAGCQWKQGVVPWGYSLGCARWVCSSGLPCSPEPGANNPVFVHLENLSVQFILRSILAIMLITK